MPNDTKKGLSPGDIKNKQLEADLSQKAIESGAAYDYNKIQAENPVSDTAYRGQENAYDIKSVDYFDPYTDYVAEGTLRGGQFGTEDLNTIRANNQSNWEQAGNAVGRLAVNIVPQIVSGFASMVDLPGYWDAEHAANNAFVKMADSIKTWSNDVLPIYEENPEDYMQMGDFAWWMTRGEGLVESVGSFIAQGAGVGKAVSLGAKGAARLLAMAMSAKTAKTAVGAASKLTTAAMLNQSEAVIEASQVYQTTLDSNLAKGMSYEDAKLKASQAAATTMNLNRVNILLNLTSAGAFLSPQKLTRQLLTAPGLKTVGKEILKEGTQEAGEELINLYAQKAGESRGRGEKDYLSKGLKDIDAMEGFEAAFLGAIGGMAQTGGTSALKASKYGPGSIKNEDGTRVSGLTNERERYAQQQQVIQEMKANGVKVTDALMNIKEQQEFEQKLFDASQRGDAQEVSNLQQQMFENQVLKAFNSGSTEVLEELYKAEAQRDPAEVGPEYIAKANEALKRMAALEDIYNNYEDYSNVNEIFFNRATADRVAIQEKNLDATVKNSQVDFGMQVREIADKYKFKRSHEGVIKEDGKEVDRVQFSQERNLPYDLSNIEENQGDTEENRATYKKFLNEVKKTQAYKAYEGYQAQHEQVKKLQNSLREQFAEITSPEYQQKVGAQKAEAAKVSAIKDGILAATTIPEIEKLAAQTENESVQKLAAEKLEVIKNQNAAIAKQKKIDLITGELNNKIAQADLDQQEILEKEIEDAEISKERKVELRNKLANRIKLLNGELVEGTTDIADPLSVFTQGDELESQINQEDKDFATTLPSSLPIPSAEAETVENQIINAAESLIQEDKTFLVGMDPQGNLIFNYDRSSEGYNRAAYLSREFNQTDSLGIIDREEFTNNIDNPQVLGPNNLLAGTKLVLSVDTEYQGEKYDPSSTTRATISWPARLAQLQQFAAQNGVPVTDLPEYIAEVPIKVSLENGEKVFYVHDNSWYKEENLNATPEEIEEDRLRNFKIRQTVIKKGIAKSKVQYKSFGKLFKTADGKPIVLSEAMPDSKLIVATGKDGGFKLPGDEKKLLNGGTIINKTSTQEGRPYAIVQVGPKEYLAIPLQRQKLEEEIIDSILFAVEAHLTNDSANPVAKAIASETGLDILDTEGLRQYVNQFTYIFPTEKAEGLENILVQGGQKGKLTSTTPLLSITPAGDAAEIQFGKPGVAMASYVDPTTGRKVTKYTVSISRNFNGTTKGIESNRQNMAKLRGILKSSLSNVLVENLALNKNAAVIISNTGEMKPMTYMEYVKGSHTSNVISTNIGTEEKPEWVYTIQPTILFDTKFAGIDSTQKQRAAKPTVKVVPPPVVLPTTAPVSVPTMGTTIEEQIAKLRADEQLELADKIPNIEIYKVNGEIDTSFMTPEESAKYNEIYDKYDNLITPLLSASQTQPSAAEEVEELAGQALIDANAKELLLSGTTLEILKGFTENIENDAVDTSVLLAQGFPDRATALASYKRAIEIAEEKESINITLPNGVQIIIDGTTVDDADPEDDTTIDDSLPVLEDSNIADIKEEAGSLMLQGLGTTEQYSLISYLAADIMQKALNAKEVDGIRTIETAPVFEKNLESLKQMYDAYKKAGLPNKAKKTKMVIDQFEKVKSLTNQYMSLLTTGSVKEDLDLNDSEQAAGLEKLVYTDEWAFTINSKATASADLRKFFSFVQAKTEDGKLITSSLGFPEIIPFDMVYDTLHEMLANQPADYETMINVLEVYKEKVPWLQSVIDNIEKAPERIQNEFVSDMSKHHISMQFIMWRKQPNGEYSLTRWSSNASAVQERLRRTWSSNMHNPLGGSNLVVVNENNDYSFDAEVADYLYETAKEWETNPAEVTNEELANWLGNFGIVLSDDTYKDLRDGKYKNDGAKSWNKLFTDSAGIVKVLAKRIKALSDQKVTVEEANILNDSAVKALAKLDAANNLNVFSNSFRSGSKTIYSYGNNNYLVNRMRDLTAYDEDNKKFINEQLINDLKQISFTRDSLWLRELSEDSAAGKLMRNNLRLDYVSLEALKQEYRASQDNSKLKDLNVDEHEAVRLGMFFNASKHIIDGEIRRVASLFYQTMSDKSTMLTMSFVTKQVELRDEGISKKNLESLYDAVVQPEVNRMRGHQTKDIKGYEPNYFYLFPGLNELMIDFNGTEQSFRDIVMANNDAYFQPEVKEQVLNYLSESFNTLLADKLADWSNLGIGITEKDAQGRQIEKHSLLDREYMSKIAQGNSEGKVRYAAADYLFNTLLANSEMYKLFAGDPALYAKFNPKKSLSANLEETFVNLGKRLAADIAPGIELANSRGSSYYQICLADKELAGNNVLDKEQKAYFNKIVSTYSEDYGAMEGSDAQEYTTWQEHLHVMKQLGRLTQNQFNTISRKLTNQSNGVFGEANKLSYNESLIVMQPMKPVYVGNTASVDDNVDRRVYVKSSSFPLLPELTAGMQLDKLRQALEKFEASKKGETSANGSPKFVRASFGTANKVGANSKKGTLEIFDDKGNINDNLEITDQFAIELDRANFRIQQDVPYDRDKTSINVGTQERKLLFVNALDVEVSKGRTGQDLMNEYNQAYDELFVNAQQKLSKKLGLIEEVTPDDVFTTFAQMNPDASVIEEIAAKSEEIAKISSPIKKQTAQQEFAEEIGEDILERVNFINKNFDKIVEALTASKINVFFDENDQFKKCD
jgi:hypothetical protein